MGRHLRPSRRRARSSLPDRPVLDLGPGVHADRRAGQGQDLQGRLRVLRRRRQGDGPVRLHGRRDAQPRASPSLPAEDVAKVKDTLAKMLAGTFGRFDVFAGPIKDNTGKELLPAGSKLEQSDLDQFPPGAPGSRVQDLHVLVERRHHERVARADRRRKSQGVRGDGPELVASCRHGPMAPARDAAIDRVRSPRPPSRRRASSSRFPGIARERRRRLRRARRRDPRAPRRERGRQEHADERPRRALPARRGPAPSWTARRSRSVAARRDRGTASGWSISISRWSPRRPSTENVLLGMDRPRFRLDLRKTEAEVDRSRERFGLHVDPRAHVWQLSVGEQQRVEILKMLHRGARILIMDEPTAVLAPQEAEELFVTLRSMTAAGGASSSSATSSARSWPSPTGSRSCAAVEVTARRAPGGHDHGPISPGSWSVGRSSRCSTARRWSAAGSSCRSAGSRPSTTVACPPCATCRSTSRPARSSGSPRSPATARPSSPRSSPGCGAARGPDHDRRVGRRQPARRRTRSGHGVGHVPEDRAGVGSSPNLSIVDNLIMKRYRRRARRAAAGSWTTRRRGRWRPRPQGRATRSPSPSIDTQARLLSGGNLQRLILAREIDAAPTPAGRGPADARPGRRGDRGRPPDAARAAVSAGTAILLISEDLDEILALADRIDVMYEGRIAARSTPRTADIHEIGLLHDRRCAA